MRGAGLAGGNVFGLGERPRTGARLVHPDHGVLDELQVLRLVARGYSSQQIAKQILVGVKTVETYRSRLAQKLGLRTRSEIVRFAVHMGLLTPETLEAEEGRPAR